MKLVFTADLVPTKLNEQAFIDGDVELLFGDTLDVLKGADRVIVNLECALTETDAAIKKIGPPLKASPRAILSYQKANVTDCALANNHIFDYGIQGLKDTMETLEKAGIGYTGIGENDQDCRAPYVIERDGKKIAIINVCEHEYSYALPDRIGANAFDPFLTMRDIRNAKKSNDYVIVLYHGGKEHCQYPSPRLRTLCQEMVENGASVVLAQHSHCIGCYEKYNDGHILYGQGNFHFAYPGYSGDKWSTGLITEVVIEDDLKVNFYPYRLTDISLSLLKGEDKQNIMSGFETRNQQLKTGEWRDGWRAFCEENKARYVKCLENFGGGADEDERKRFIETFAHLLDCEAHTDVWRELFPTLNLTNEK